MNDSNPYESPSAKSESRSWGPIDLFVIGLWLAIPIGVFLGRQFVLPVFTDFEVELPTATPYLLHRYSPILLTIASMVVLLAMSIAPVSGTRRRFMWVACISGVFTGGICLLLILGPLLSLWRNLS